MRRPEKLWDQYHGKAGAELMRGSAQWPLQPHPCALEPPWEGPYDRQCVNVWDCYINDWEGPWEGSLIKRTFAPGEPVYQLGQPILLDEVPCPSWEGLVPIVVEQFPEDEVTIPKADQLLRSLSFLNRPVSFELLAFGARPQFDHQKFKEIMNANGKGDRRRKYEEAICGWDDPLTRVQFVTHQSDAKTLYHQLLAHYPNSAVMSKPDLDNQDIDPGSAFYYGKGRGATLALSEAYCFPLRLFTRLDPDPLGVAIAAMDHLPNEEWALLQILFQPVRYDWADTVRRAVQDPYRPGEFLFNDITDRQLNEKFSSPLFSVAIHLLTSQDGVFDHLMGWAEQFVSLGASKPATDGRYSTSRGL